MILRRLTITVILTITLYLIYVQVMFFEQKTLIEKYKSENESLINKIKNDSVLIINQQKELELIQNNWDVLQEENDVLASIVAEKEFDYESNN